MAVVLGLLAGLLFAVSASLQQVAAREQLHDRAPSGGLAGVLPVVGVLGRLVRSRTWLAGWVTNLTGFLTQAGALRLGSVAVVQPLLVSQLLFSLPLSAARTGRRPLVRDWLAGGAVCVGVALFLWSQPAAPLSGAPDRQRVLAGALAAAVAVAALLLAGRRTAQRRVVHAACVSVAAGICFAMSAVLMKLTAHDLLDRGVGATAVDWPGYSLALSTLLGLLIEQDAFATGALSTALAGMNIANPVASYCFGILTFGEGWPSGPGALTAFAVAAALLVAGVVGLANSPSVHRELAEADVGSPSADGDRPPAWSQRD